MRSGHRTPRVALPPCALQHSHAPAPRPAPDGARPPTLSGTLRATVKSAFRAPAQTDLYPAGTSGGTYFGSADAVGLVDAEGQVRWELQPRPDEHGARWGMQLMPTEHNVVVVIGNGDAAVLDGATGRLLACGAGSNPQQLPLVDGDTVSYPTYAGSGTTVRQFNPAVDKRFVNVGTISRQLDLRGTDGRRAVLSHTVDYDDTGSQPSQTVVGWLDGARTFRMTYTDPLSTPLPKHAWSNLTIFGVSRAITVVGDVYESTLSGGGQVPGAIAGLDTTGRAVWRAAGGDNVVVGGDRVTIATAGGNSVDFVVRDSATGARRAAVSVPDRRPGIRGIEASSTLTWTRTDESIIALSDTGKYQLIRPADADRNQITASHAGPASPNCAITVKPILGAKPPTTYIVGP